MFMHASLQDGIRPGSNLLNAVEILVSGVYPRASLVRNKSHSQASYCVYISSHYSHFLKTILVALPFLGLILITCLEVFELVSDLLIVFKCHHVMVCCNSTCNINWGDNNVI